MKSRLAVLGAKQPIMASALTPPPVVQPVVQPVVLPPLIDNSSVTVKKGSDLFVAGLFDGLSNHFALISRTINNM